LIRDCLPGFAHENALTLLNEAILPRIWLGNAITTPTHLDEWNNIGCVVIGRRRFTLFPPQQVANLYIGPLDFAPTGAPMSLVSLHEPDLQRFPRFREALAAAVSAELGPGDAIFIPPLWWHHVESLERFNMLVNYWWHASSDGRTAEAAAGGYPSGGGKNSAGVQTASVSGFDTLVHALLNFRTLPPATRESWQALFDHFVFGSQSDITGHIPEHRHGILGPLTPEDVARLRAFLKERL